MTDAMTDDIPVPPLREIGEIFTDNNCMWGSHWCVVAHRAPVNGEYYQNYHTVTKAGGHNYDGIWSIVVPHDPAHGPWPLQSGRPRGLTVSQLIERLENMLMTGDVTEDTEVWFGDGCESMRGDEPVYIMAPHATAVWPKTDEFGCIPDNWERYEEDQHKLKDVLIFRP